MLRVPHVQSQSLINNGHTYQQIPLLNQRPNETTRLSDVRSNSKNGFVKKDTSMFREPLPTSTINNSHLSIPLIASSHVLLQSRVSDPSLAASVALVQQQNSADQPKQSAFEIPNSSLNGITPSLHMATNGGIPNLDVSQIHISHNECRSKYDRLLEAHRKLQRTNGALEDKLLRIVEKYEGEKNTMRMDLASQTQKLVESKLMIQQLHDQNAEIQSDLQLSITLLRNRPTSFMSQRLDTLPPDIQQRVRTCLAENARDRQLQRLSRGPPEGRKIRVAIPSDDNITSACTGNGASDSDKISAAILAKVLEERDKERQGDRQLRIDVGTQTQGWNHFPGSDKIHAPTSSSSSSSSTASCINKEICELTNESNKGENSVLSSPENISLTERLSPLPKPETIDVSTVCNSVGTEYTDPTEQQQSLPTTSNTVQHQPLTDSRLNLLKDGPLPSEPYFPPTFISNSCRPMKISHETAFPPQSSHPNNTPSSILSTTNSITTNNSNLIRSSSTINSTNVQSNVIPPTNIPTSKLESSSFLASAASSYLTRSATFSVKQTDI